MRYLIFDLMEGTDDVFTLEAMATTTDVQAHEAARVEAEQVVAWAHQAFPNRHGPVEEGYAWDHQLLIQHEVGEWINVTLTISASPEFVEAFQANIVDPED
jgi:hypothetical protein